ncbi:hypothetical protein [Aureimonas sp. ME7]|uniref:hypothetical protein n=1 Tax=Aureimonas sp. ME7 TaxID=2744252 RepID=UPI0015F6FAE9|nr:hypothetical protein [Aureimonas sp. ME7]
MSHTEAPFTQDHGHPLAKAGVERMFLGMSRHAETGFRRRHGEIWIVRHAGETEWIAIYRLDPRDRRTVHLERVLDGASWRDGLAFAIRTFALEAERSVVAASPAARTASANDEVIENQARAAAA